MWINPVLQTTLRAIYGHIHGLLLVGGADIQPQRYHEQHHPALALWYQKSRGYPNDSIFLASRKRLANKKDPIKGLRHGTYLD